MLRAHTIRVLSEKAFRYAKLQPTSASIISLSRCLAALLKQFSTDVLR